MRRSTRFRTVGKISDTNEVKASSLDGTGNSFHASSSSESDSGRRLRPRNLLPEYCEDKLIKRTIAPTKSVNDSPSVGNKVTSSSSKLKKPENHLIVVFKPSSNPDSSSFIPNRMRLLPSAALDKLHSELFPQKGSKADDVIGSNSTQLVSTSSSSIGATGLRRISSRRQQQLQQQQSDHHFSSSSGFSNMSSINGSNGRGSVRPKLGHNVPRDVKEPALHEMDTNTYARYLNLIAKDTYSQVPMVDLKKSWPLRNQSRTQTPTRLSSSHRHSSSHKSEMSRRSDQTIRLTSNTGSLGKPLQVINLKNGSFGSIPNSGVKQASSDLTRTELDRKQWLDCIKTKEVFVHSQKKPHVVIQQKANGMLVMKPLMGSTQVTCEQESSNATVASSNTPTSRRIPNMHEHFFKELNHLLPYTGACGNVHSSEERKMLSRFIQKYQLKPASKCRLGLELTSSLGRRILEVYSYLTEIKSGIQVYRLIRMYEKYCSTNPSMHRELLRILKNTSGKLKIEFKIPSPLKQNCSTRLLRSCDVINKSTAAWGLNSYHLYTFSKQERLEKNLTLTTGLDWKGRLMAIGCDRISGSQLFANSTLPLVKCTVCKGKINPDVGHSCGSINSNQLISATCSSSSSSSSSVSSPFSPGNIQIQSGRSTRTSSRHQQAQVSNRKLSQNHHRTPPVDCDFIDDQSIQIPACGYTPIRSNVTAKTISAALASGSLSALFCDTANGALDSTHDTCPQDITLGVTGTSNGRMTLRAGPRQGQQMSSSTLLHTNQLLTPLTKLIPSSSYELMKLESESESLDEIILHSRNGDDDDDEREDDDDEEEEELVLIGPSSVSRNGNSQISSGNSTSSSHRGSSNFLSSTNNGNIEVLIEF